MMFGQWGNPDHDDSIRIIHRALDAGINFIDTADVYSRGESEQIVGKALGGGKRDNVVLATKVHGTMGDDPNQFGNSRRWIVREVEKDVLPTARRHAMGVIAWSPLAGGWLSGRYRKGTEIPQSARADRLPARYDLSTPENQRKLEAADALARLADEAGLTLIEMAIAFVIRHPAVTAAIIGPRTMEHLESQLTAADVTLSDDVLDRIDEIVAPGVNVNPGDGGWQNPALEPAARRR
jgi:aryl-alcohol dehydrogenase-like predicted oxidoreductase